MNPPYSWQPLGALLVAKGLLTENQLQWALSEQHRTGRLVGEILVESGTISAFALARALTEQHGVELQTRKEAEPEAPPHAVWRPLGKLLVEDGFLTSEQLQRALHRQQESRGRRKLGEILVAEGFLSGIDLARALAKQNGVVLDQSEDVETVVRPVVTEQFVYQVFEISYEPHYKAHEVLYESASFLEAVEFAAEHIEDADPAGLEIQRTSGGTRETVWTYSDSRAAAAADERRGLTQTFGFDPTLWGGAPA
ncbi:MAG TPA: hypothetical protein VKC65_03215 [Gaiellaceae bacterium]|nr:hypothetical protein [Gaiellaceae bacterium]